MNAYVKYRRLSIAIVICFSGACMRDARTQMLFDAIKSGDTVKVTSMIADKRVDVNATGKRGITPLLQALYSKEKKIYLKLLEGGADPNQCDAAGSCVMNCSAEESDSYWLEQALKHGGNPDAINTGNPHYPNITPVFYAIYKKQSRNVDILLEAGADVNHRDGYGTTPLRAAAGTGKYEIVYALLERNANPKLTNKHGRDISDWFNGRDDSLVVDPSQIKWFQKSGDFLIEKGLLERAADGSFKKR